MTKPLLAFLCSFALSVVLMPIIIKFFKKKQASQTVLGYVENHKEKNGTLTMGGVVFMLTTLGLSFYFLNFNNSWFVVLLVSVFYGVLGLMDDYLKIKFKQNLGLRAYQKIIGQVGISLIFAIFIYFSTIGGEMFLPFSEKTIDVGFWVIPIIVLVMVATTNSVNLTDGLDGCAPGSKGAAPTRRRRSRSVLPTPRARFGAPGNICSESLTMILRLPTNGFVISLTH